MRTCSHWLQHVMMVSRPLALTDAVTASVTLQEASFQRVCDWPVVTQHQG
jgi:hypothetical protein